MIHQPAKPLEPSLRIPSAHRFVGGVSNGPMSAFRFDKFQPERDPMKGLNSKGRADGFVPTIFDFKGIQLQCATERNRRRALSSAKDSASCLVVRDVAQTKGWRLDPRPLELATKGLERHLPIRGNPTRAQRSSADPVRQQAT